MLIRQIYRRNNFQKSRECFNKKCEVICVYISCIRGYSEAFRDMILHYGCGEMWQVSVKLFYSVKKIHRISVSQRIRS